ncbi:hypothetical protein H2201_000171 [Coniosporium apollinis]|uniref:BZIP domain-containing protein n=2 Tax=Coniosporium TaxID=2810619 RepID=A0ABQ9P944_9PEZI|nr:hypothetical protein H2199_008188 [Cladosporium sp. JES 115]KAJ9669786.1 hypothetical protein H2201_000171 [Coniosporium apollinis]
MAVGLSPRRAQIDVSPLPPKLDTTAGARSHLFQPPQTPASSYSSSTFTSANFDNLGNGSLKRSRHDSESYFTTPYSATASGWSNVSAASSILHPTDLASPAPLINTRYTLAGGLDTPGLAAASSYDGANTLAYEENFRRRWSMTSSAQHDGSITTPGPLAGERNGKRRHPSSPHDISRQTWSQTVLHLAGAVAGKMWDFCRASAFRGFYAGGGQGYSVTSTDSIWEDLDARQPVFSPFEYISTPVPGDFPPQHTDHGTDFIHRGETPTPPRPTKRIHTDTGSGWVMVDRHSDSRASSPRLSTRRTPSQTSTTASNATPRSSHLPRPVAQPRPQLTRPPSHRRSLIPVSRRASGASLSGSPALQHHHMNNNNSPASFASARVAPATKIPSRPGSRAGLTQALPSPEAKKYAARLRREEREADRSLRKMNERLRDMVREGKEALGSRVEIVEDEVMGGVPWA